MDNLLQMPDRIFSARLFCVPWENKHLKVAATVDGFIDLATPESGTYPLSPEEAAALIEALKGAIADVDHVMKTSTWRTPWNTF